jgi:hypothetical protein
VLKYPTTNDLYLQAIQEMYPGINTGRLSSNLTYYENWEQVRATAALKAFTTVKKMTTEKKIVYDNRASLSDDESSDGCYASYVQKKQRKRTWTRMTRSSSQVYQPVMPCFLPLFNECFRKLLTLCKV